jgi:hypothetical protein
VLGELGIEITPGSIFFHGKDAQEGESAMECGQK